MTIDILNKKPSAETINEIRYELENKNSPLRIEYLLDVDDRVNDYLQDRQSLVIVLFQLLPLTADCFKGDRLHLTIIKDPENCSPDRFVIVVNTHLSSDMALAKLQELDDRCFQANIPNDILVHVEFL
jgi:hypothetical protein